MRSNLLILAGFVIVALVVVYLVKKKPGKPSDAKKASKEAKETPEQEAARVAFEKERERSHRYAEDFKKKNDALLATMTPKQIEKHNQDVIRGRGGSTFTRTATSGRG